MGLVFWQKLLLSGWDNGIYQETDMAAAYEFERAGGVKVVSLEKKRLQRLC